MIVGTKSRTEVLGQPVRGTVVRGNVASVSGTAYSWVHGHDGTVFVDNRIGNQPAALVEGDQPPIDPFLFVKDLWIP